MENLKINAIKKVRTAAQAGHSLNRYSVGYGTPLVGLKDAKDFVEELFSLGFEYRLGNHGVLIDDEVPSRTKDQQFIAELLMVLSVSETLRLTEGLVLDGVNVLIRSYGLDLKDYV